MRTILYRRWAPAQSSVHIEFPPGLIHDIRAQSPSGYGRGYLFGRREGNEVRVMTALREPLADDPRIVGLDAVGVFVTRVRGEVFLTDSDLEQVERVANGIAFVIAGSRAGFFTRAPDGSMQTVRSHEEFLLADAAPLAESPDVLVPPSPLLRGRHPGRPPVRLWRWAAGAAVLLSGPMAALAYLHPRIAQPPIALSLRESNGQLVVRWDPRETAAREAHLEIADAGEQSRYSVRPGASGATYAARSGDVEILLSAGQRTGRIHWTSARFIVQARQEAAVEFRARAQMLDEVEQLQQQAVWFRQSIARRQGRVQELTAAADALLARQNPLE